MFLHAFFFISLFLFLSQKKKTKSGKNLITEKLIIARVLVYNRASRSSKFHCPDIWSYTLQFTTNDCNGSRSVNLCVFACNYCNACLHDSIIFFFSEFVKWLVESREENSVDEAILLGQALLDCGIIHHGEQLTFVKTLHN